MYLNELHHWNEGSDYDTVDTTHMNETRDSASDIFASTTSTSIFPLPSMPTPNKIADIRNYEQLNKRQIDSTAYTNLHPRCQIRYKKCIIFCSILCLLLVANIVTAIFLVNCLRSKTVAQPRDCVDVQKQNVGTTSGIYIINVLQRFISVYCEMDTDGGGWTVFQNRFDGSEDFNRTMFEYVYGFGNFTGEFWLGLENIFDLTSERPNVLRVDLMDDNGLMAYETFQLFSLSRRPEYKLFISAPEGTAGNSLMEHIGQPFSNKDQNQEYSNCSQNFWNGWWFKPPPYHNCFQVNLNGRYLPPGTNSWLGIIYNTFRTSISLKKTRMMIRRQKFN